MTQSRRNIELKARLADLEQARNVAETLATEVVGVEHQQDTYFGCRTGRLKLRERRGLPAQLIAYHRTDDVQERPSDYRLVEIADPSAVKGALEAALGIETVVVKRREIFLHENVRIHLDDVEGLGTYLEFEAVLSPEDSEAEQYARLTLLRERFAIADEDIVSGSYGAQNAT